MDISGIQCAHTQPHTRILNIRAVVDADADMDADTHLVDEDQQASENELLQQNDYL